MRTALVALWALTATAAATERHLQLLPADKLERMGSVLRLGDVALIESFPDGKMKQVTILSLVAAPPEVVHDALVNPEKYPEFIRNMSQSHVTRNRDGTIDDEYVIDLTLTHFEGTNRFHPNPDGSVDVKAIDPNDDAVFRWEFYRVPGGTVMVQYGYTDVLHSNDYIRKMTTQVPTMEHGLALSAQLAYVRSLKARAEHLARPGSFPPFDPSAKGPGFGFLLERGTVTVIRSYPNGRLAEFSILDRVGAPLARVEQVVDHPADWSRFMDGARSSSETRRSPAEVLYHLITNVSVFSWDAHFDLHDDGHGHIDVLGVDGDLRGAQYRWDLAAIGDKVTQLVYRARQDIAAASPFLLGLLFKKEPLFEHGISVAIGLLQVAGVHARAEGRR